MKKMFLLLVVFFLCLTGCTRDDPPAPGDNDIVYVCTSNSAKTYHTYRDCGSLKTCKEDVLEVTRRKARENERIVCMNCKKREEAEGKNKDSVK